MKHDYEPIRLKRFGEGPSFQSKRDLLNNRLENNNVGSLRDAVENLRETVSEAGPEQIIRELSIHETIRSSVLDVLHQDTGIPPALVEYLFGICITSTSTPGSSDKGFYDVLDSLSLVYYQSQSKQIEKIADAETIEEKQEAFVSYQLLEKELTTGPFGHGRQRREYARKVLGKCDDYIESELGVSATESVMYADVVGKHFSEHIAEAIRFVLSSLVPEMNKLESVSQEEILYKDKPGLELLKKVAEYDNMRIDPIAYDDYVDDQREKIFGNLSSSLEGYGIEQDELLSSSEYRENKFRNFIQEFSIEVGTYDSNLMDMSGSVGKFDYPFDHNPIHESPIVRGTSGRMYHGPKNSIYYSLSTRLYYDLLSSEYKDQASSLIGYGNEEWIAECLENISDDNVEIHHNVDFDYQDGESDLVLVYDDHLIVIESKTRGPKLDTRKGPFADYDDIQSNLSEIISEPYDQAMKLINSVREDRIEKLYTEDEEIPISSDDFEGYVPMVVLARSLNAVGTMLYADAVDFDYELPFLTDIYSLQTISRHVKNSTDFLEYIRRRVDVAEDGRVFSIDELDYLGAYLENKLRFPDAPSECMIDIVHAGSHLENTYNTNGGIGVSGDMEHL